MKKSIIGVGEQAETGIEKSIFIADFYSKLGIKMPEDIYGNAIPLGGWVWDEAEQEYEYDPYATPCPVGFNMDADGFIKL